MSFLLDQLDARVRADPRLRTLSAEDAAGRLSSLEARLGIALRSPWPWKAVPATAATSHPYTGDGLAHLRAVLALGDEVFLFATDDEPPPWPCVTGPAIAVLELIAELPFFEYLLAASDGTWLIFDTHHNVLVSVGDRCPLAGHGTMTVELVAAVQAALARQAPADDLVELLRHHRAAGGSQASAQAALEAVRPGLTEDAEDRVLDLLDRVVGFCAPRLRVWPDPHD